jgi:flavin reductase (DIM6/NTAB) family NADH-FMN oxidoreductase RutF
MQSIDPTSLERRDLSRLMGSVVVPRPIAWVSTQDAQGARNLAPFSFFNLVGYTPPMVMFSVGSRAGEQKDTLRNIEALGEMVIHLPDEQLATAMNATSGEYTAGVDEFDVAGLEAVPSVMVRPPRVAQAPIALEARLVQVVTVPATGYTIVLAEVVYLHIRDGLLRSNGLIDAEAWRPIARLGGSEYTTLGQVFEMERPKV